MSILSKPEVVVPEYTITDEQTIEICKFFHGANPNIDKILQMIKNTGVKKRHIVQPIEKTLVHYGVEKRHEVYEKEAKRLALEVSKKALNSVNISGQDIDLLIVNSCTGFLFPSLTAFLINALPLNRHTKQLPIAQLGCAAGSASINRAADYCKAYPNRNVLIVSVELCSLLYQPTDNNFGVLISNSLFGDGASACVVSNNINSGIKIHDSESFLYENSERYIAYDVKETGWHFHLDKAVPKTMEVIAPEIKIFVKKVGLTFDDLKFYSIHAGGPRILNDLVHLLDVPQKVMKFSREGLQNYGNTASVFIFESTRRILENKHLTHGQKGLIAGFGPGLTAEFSLGSVVEK